MAVERAVSVEVNGGLLIEVQEQIFERFEVGELLILDEFDAVPEFEQFRIAHFVHEAEHLQMRESLQKQTHEVERQALVGRELHQKLELKQKSIVDVAQNVLFIDQLQMSEARNGGRQTLVEARGQRGVAEAQRR